MKIYIALVYIFVQAWALSACAASADSATAQNQININGEEYHLLSNVVLIKDPNWQRVPQPEISLQQLDNVDASQSTKASTKEKVEESQAIAHFGSMQLVPTTSVAAQQALANNPRKSEKNKSLYVRNSSGQVFIVNGEIFASTQSKEQAQAIAKDYPIKFGLFIKRSKRALFTASANDQLFDLINNMQSDDRMSQVELRLINDLVVPH